MDYKQAAIELASKVPPSVVDGTYQMAVDWKKLAEKALKTAQQARPNQEVLAALVAQLRVYK